VKNVASVSTTVSHGVFGPVKDGKVDVYFTVENGQVLLDDSGFVKCAERMLEGAFDLFK